MTFPSLDRAFDYLVGQNPGKVIFVYPTRWEGGGVSYQLELHKSESVRTVHHAGELVRVVRLDLTAEGEWDIKVSEALP